MFSEIDRKRITQVAHCAGLAGRLALVKRAAGPNPYLMDAFSNLPSTSLRGWHPAPPSNFMEHLGTSGRGLLAGAGNLGRTIFTGHHGQPGILGNYWNKLTDTVPEFWRNGRAPWNAPTGSPVHRAWGELTSAKPVLGPWYEAGKERAQAMGEAGSLGGYVSQPFIRGYYGLKSLFSQPISAPIRMPQQ
jgi:hypothetical protein